MAPKQPIYCEARLLSIPNGEIPELPDLLCLQHNLEYRPWLPSRYLSIVDATTSVTLLAIKLRGRHGPLIFFGVILWLRDL